MILFTSEIILLFSLIKNIIASKFIYEKNGEIKSKIKKHMFFYGLSKDEISISQKLYKKYIVYMYLKSAQNVSLIIIHKTAKLDTIKEIDNAVLIVGKGAEIEKNCSFKKFVYIGKSSKIKSSTVMKNRVFIDDNVAIGKNCKLENNIYLGRNSKIFSNSVLKNSVFLQKNNNIEEGFILENGVYFDTNFKTKNLFVDKDKLKKLSNTIIIMKAKKMINIIIKKNSEILGRIHEYKNERLNLKILNFSNPIYHEEFYKVLKKFKENVKNYLEKIQPDNKLYEVFELIFAFDSKTDFEINVQANSINKKNLNINPDYIVKKLQKLNEKFQKDINRLTKLYKYIESVLTKEIFQDILKLLYD